MILEITINQNCCSLKSTNKIGRIKITIRDDGRFQMANEKEIKTEGCLMSKIKIHLMIWCEKINKRKIILKVFIVDFTDWVNFVTPENLRGNIRYK